MDSLLNTLKEASFRFQIDPLKTVEHAAKVNTVIKVLTDINRSYNNFLEIEFLKNSDFKKAYEKNPKTFDTVKEELSLLIVDVKFGSFETAVAPNLLDVHSPIFKNEVLEWKKETFKSYKDIVLLGDYQNHNHLQNVVQRYSEEERTKIFQPFFTSIGDGTSYKINIKNEQGVVTKTLHQPEKSKLIVYTPKTVVVEELPEEKNYLVYAKLKKTGKGKEVNFNKRNIKQVHYMEELAHDIFPYKPNLLQYGKIVFVLTSRIECKVSYQDGSYVIESPDLDLLVWGETREQVEEAFSFSFYSLYENFVLENDKKLSPDAIVLKKKLKSLIKSVIDETKKK